MGSFKNVDTLKDGCVYYSDSKDRMFFFLFVIIY